MGKLYLATEDDVRILKQMRRWIKNFRGDGVRNEADSATIRRSGVRGKRPGYVRKQQPILARVTAVYDNFLTVKRVDASLAVTGDAFNCAKPMEVRKSTYAAETHVDPLDSAVSLTYAYTSSQERTVTKDDGGDETEEDQRIVPWYVPHATTGSLIQIIGYPATVKDDDGTTDVVCSFTEHDSPRAWAKV